MIVKITELFPSQLYINADKLKKIQKKFELTSIPIIFLENRFVMTDGHTRVVAAILNGFDEIETHIDTDNVDIRAYRNCIQWCLDENIKSPYDLVNRIISSDRHNVLWLERCKAMQLELIED